MSEDIGLNVRSRLHHRAFPLLFLALMSVGMGQSLAFIVVPPVAFEIGLTEIQIGLIYASSAVLWLLTSARWGSLSDFWGRRPVIIIGLIGYALSLMLFVTVLRLGQWGWLPVALLFPLLVLARVINGGFGSATRPATLGFVADFTTSFRRAGGISRIEAGFALGIALGPLLGSLLFIYSDMLPFYIFAGVGLLMALLIWRVLPSQSDHLPAVHPVARPRAGKLRYSDSRIWPFMVLAGAQGIAHASITQTAALYYKNHLGVTDTLLPQVGLAFAAMSGTVFLMTMLVVPRLGLQPRSLLRFGPVLLLCAFVLLALSSEPAQVVLAMGVFGIGTGMCTPGRSAAMSLINDRENQGRAMGMVGSIMPVGHILSPLLTMPLFIYSPAAAYGMNGLVMLFVICFIALHPQYRRVMARDFVPGLRTIE